MSRVFERTVADRETKYLFCIMLKRQPEPIIGQAGPALDQWAAHWYHPFKGSEIILEGGRSRGSLQICKNFMAINTILREQYNHLILRVPTSTQLPYENAYKILL